MAQDNVTKGREEAKLRGWSRAGRSFVGCGTKTDHKNRTDESAGGAALFTSTMAKALTASPERGWAGPFSLSMMPELFEALITDFLTIDAK